MDKLVSIVVPVYNMERYLKKCVDSLLSQTYANIEIILVDDGSRDGSLDICREYEASDPRVRAVHKKNGGLSSARNAGLDAMRGELVTFVDADDYLERDAVEVMACALADSGADIAYMQANLINPDYTVRSTKGSDTRGTSVTSSRDYIRGMCRKQKSESVCDKLFRSSLFAEHRFPEGRLNEDFYFLSRLLMEELRVVEVDYAGYNYYQREGSITNSGFSKSIVDAVKNSLELKDIACDECPELEDSFAGITLTQARVALITMPYEMVKNRSEELKVILAATRICLPHLRSSGLGFSGRAFMRLVCRMPRLTLRITSILWNIKRKA